MKKIVFSLLMFTGLVGYGQDNDAEGIDTTRHVKFLEMMVKGSLAALHLDMGIEYYHNKDYEAAVSELTRYPGADTSFLAHYYRGLSRFELGLWVKAIDDFTAALSLDSTNSYMYYMRGRAKAEITMYPGACMDFRRADQMGMEAAEEMIDKYCQPDTIHTYSKDPEKEIAGLNKATEMDSGMAELYLEKAFAEVRAFDYQAAMADQTKAIELNPNYKEAYFNRGLAKVNTQDLEGGLADFNKALQLDTQYTDAYFGRASVKMKQGKYKEALTDFDKAISLNPADGKSYMLRGMCRLGLNQNDEACADLHRADELGYFQAPQMIAKYCAAEKQLPKTTMPADDIPADSLSSPLAWYNHGVSKLEAHDYAASIPYFDKALNLDPMYVDAYYARGGVEMQLKQYWECIHDMDKALAIDPKASKCYLLRGDSRFRMLNDIPVYANDSGIIMTMRIDSACNDMYMAEQLGEKNAGVYIEEYCNRAKKHTYSSKLLPTSSEAGEIPTDSVSSPLAWFTHGMAKMNKDDYVAAIPFFNKALELDPKYVDAHFALGNIALISKQYHRCFREMNTAIAADSTDAKCYLLRGAGRLAMIEDDRGGDKFSVEEKKAQTDSACRDLHTAEDLGDFRATEYIEHYCLDAEGHFQLGLKLIKQKYEKQALDEFDKAVIADDHLAKAYAYRAYCEMHYHKQEAAKEDLIVALNLDPKYAKAYYFRAMQSGEYKRNFNTALPDMDRAIQLDSTDTEMYLYRAFIRDELKDYTGAEADLSRVIILDPTDAKAYKFRGEERSELKDYRGAVSDYDHVIALDSMSYEIFKLRGRAKASLGDYQGAIADYTSSIKKDSSDFRSWLERGIAWNKLRSYSAAIADFNEAQHIYPRSYEVFNNRGYSWQMYGMPPSAMADYNQAIFLNPDDAETLTNRGNAKRDGKDYQGALADFNHAINYHPLYAEAYYYRALLEIDMKQMTAACADLKKASESGNKDADDLLAKYCK
jgi:tetratricopeptide (TPR) repeat protein